MRLVPVVWREMSVKNTGSKYIVLETAGSVTDVTDECFCPGSSCRVVHRRYKNKKNGYLSNQIVIKRKGAFRCYKRIPLNYRLVIIT